MLISFRCSLSFPLTVAHIAVGHSTWLHFWEIQFSVDYAAASETKINLPFDNNDSSMAIRLTYDLDGSLYMTNGRGGVWHVSFGPNTNYLSLHCRLLPLIWAPSLFRANPFFFFFFFIVLAGGVDFADIEEDY